MNIKSKKISSFLQIREIRGLEDDHTDNFEDTKVNAIKLLRYMKMCEEIKPNGYTPLQLWRVTTQRVELQ